MKGYEEAYHAEVHGYLLGDVEYYNTRAKLAQKRYFKGIPNENRILEYGCGVGQNILLFPNAVGYDISEYSIKFCQGKGIKTIRSLDEVENESFDVVFSAHVLEHLENPVAALQEIKLKLKPYGKLILVLPTERQRHVKDIHMSDIAQHLYAWNFSTINNLLRRQGFEIVENEFLRGDAYKKLLPISKISFVAYETLTGLASLRHGKRELKVIAVKLPANY